MKDSMTAAELKAMLEDEPAVQVVDVRLEEDRAPVAHEIPGARWRDPNDFAAWSKEIDPARPVIVFCVHGLRVSQAVRKELRERGFNASILEGGIDAWQAHAAKTAAPGG